MWLRDCINWPSVLSINWRATIAVVLLHCYAAMSFCWQRAGIAGPRDGSPDLHCTAGLGLGLLSVSGFVG
jgi:hypothetical protein